MLKNEIMILQVSKVILINYLMAKGLSVTYW